MIAHPLSAQKVKSSTRSYREIDLVSRIESADAHGLVALLYTELQNALDVLARLGIDAPRARVLDQHQRAATILRALEAGLDSQKGGSLALDLGTIYRQLQRRLVVARDGDLAALSDVRGAVADLANAWARIG